MIAIVDYGAGNLHSVQKAVEYVGGDAIVSDSPQVIDRADKLILPGVGAFDDGMKGLEAKGLVQVIKAFVGTGRPLLGICLGMQLLFQRSEEQGEHAGLGVVPGDVLAFEPAGLKVPQIGWNQLLVQGVSPLLAGIEAGSYVYFNHSYFCQPEEPDCILATTDYGRPFASVIVRDNVYGFQFHPEKSQQVGLRLLRNFVREVR